MNLFTLVKGRFIIERAIFNKIEEWIGWSDTVCRWDSKVFEEERISDDEGFEEGGGNVREGGGGREGEGEFGRDDDGDEGRILRRFKRGKFRHMLLLLPYIISQEPLLHQNKQHPVQHVSPCPACPSLLIHIHPPSSGVDLVRRS